MDETFGRAGLIASTTCLSVRAIGTVLPDPEPIDNGIETCEPVGEVGVPGNESSTFLNAKIFHSNKKNRIKNQQNIMKNNNVKPVEVVANASLCVLGCRGFIVGTQNVSFTDTGLRFDERKLVESTVSTLYGMALLTKSAS